MFHMQENPHQNKHVGKEKWNEVERWGLGGGGDYDSKMWE